MYISDFLCVAILLHTFKKSHFSHCINKETLFMLIKCSFMPMLTCPKIKFDLCPKKSNKTFFISHHIHNNVSCSPKLFLPPSKKSTCLPKLWLALSYLLSVGPKSNRYHSYQLSFYNMHINISSCLLYLPQFFYLPPPKKIPCPRKKTIIVASYYTYLH